MIYVYVRYNNGIMEIEIDIGKIVARQLSSKCSAKRIRRSPAFRVTRRICAIKRDWPICAQRGSAGNRDNIYFAGVVKSRKMSVSMVAGDGIKHRPEWQASRRERAFVIAEAGRIFCVAY